MRVPDLHQMNTHNSSDLVARLRSSYGSRDHQYLTWGSLLDEAADEIEQLRDALIEILSRATADTSRASMCTVPREALGYARNLLPNS